MQNDRGPFDWNTWLWWIALTAVGNTTAIVVASIIISLLQVPALGATGAGQTASIALQVAVAPVFALAGAVAGFSQWIVLRGQFTRAGWWILATAGGWMAGYLWSTLLFPQGGDATNFLSLLAPWLIFGLTSGVLQWLVLRPHYDRSGLWIPTAIVTTGVGMSGWLVAAIYGGTFVWLLAAALSGYILLRVLSPKPLSPG